MGLLGTTKNKFRWQSERDLNSGPLDDYNRYNRLTTLPHLLNNHCSDILSYKECSGELPRIEMYFMSPWTKSLATKIKRNVKLSYGIFCHLSQKGGVGVLSNQDWALSRVIEQLFSQSRLVNLDGQEVKK